MSNSKIPNLQLISVLVLVMTCSGSLALADDPTLIVYNGNINTVDDSNTVFQAMALKDDLIMALGTNEDILALAGPDTVRMDMQGRMVLPGFVDPHWHLGKHMDEDFPELRGHRVPPADTLEETTQNIEEVIRETAAKAKPGEWLLIFPTGNLAREVILFETLTGEDLDRFAPNNPVYLNEVGSGPRSQSLLNGRGRALMEKEMPGFARLTDRDVKGIGTDLSASVIHDVILKGREEEYSRSLRKFLLSRTPKAGVTTAGTILTRMQINAFAILDRKGELPVRFGWLSGYTAFFEPEGFYRRFPDISGIGSKFFYNLGVGEELTDSPATGLCTDVPIKTRELTERFRKSQLDTCFLANPVMREIVKDQIAYGRGVEYHAGGDKSVDIILEIIEEIREETGMTVEQIKNKRITMEHTLMLRPDQIPILAKYGIIMTLAWSHVNNQLNPIWPSNIAKHYGEEYVNWHQPAKSLVDGGVHTILAEVGGRSFRAMQKFITREACFTPRRPEQGDMSVTTCKILVPDERIDRLTALKMSTIWPAYYALKEHQLGSLEVGKFGDFIVIDRDYFTVPEKEIENLQVLLTVLGGEVIFASPDYGTVPPDLFKSAEYIGDAVLAN